MTDALTNAERVLRDAARGVALDSASFTHAADALVAERERRGRADIPLHPIGHRAIAERVAESLQFEDVAPHEWNRERFERFVADVVRVLDGAKIAPARPTPEPSEAMVEAVNGACPTHGGDACLRVVCTAHQPARAALAAQEGT